VRPDAAGRTGNDDCLIREPFQLRRHYDDLRHHVPAGNGRRLQRTRGIQSGVIIDPDAETVHQLTSEPTRDQRDSESQKGPNYGTISLAVGL
jgi:hypothetical protein